VLALLLHEFLTREIQHTTCRSPCEATGRSLRTLSATPEPHDRESAWPKPLGLGLALGCNPSDCSRPGEPRQASPLTVSRQPWTSWLVRKGSPNPNSLNRWPRERLSPANLIF